MTITDACDINAVLKYLLGLPGPNGTAVEPDVALAAARRLAERANKALSAGITPRDVEAAWPKPGKRGKR